MAARLRLVYFKGCTEWRQRREKGTCGGGIGKGLGKKVFAVETSVKTMRVRKWGLSLGDAARQLKVTGNSTSTEAGEGGPRLKAGAKKSCYQFGEGGPLEGNKDRRARGTGRMDCQGIVTAVRCRLSKTTTVGDRYRLEAKSVSQRAGKSVRSTIRGSKKEVLPGGKTSKGR